MTEEQGLLHTSYGEKFTPEQVVDLFWASYRDADAHSHLWRTQTAPKMYRVYGNNSFRKEIKAQLEQAGRPAVEFNFALSMINAVVGSDSSDSKEVRFPGGDADTDPTDVAKGDLMTHVVRSLMSKCNGHRQDAAVLLNMLISGYGFAETYLDTGQFPVRPVRKSINPGEIWWDPNAIQDNLEDAKFLIRRRKMSLEDAQARWHEHALELEQMQAGSSSKAVQSTTPSVQGYWQPMSGPANDDRGLEIFEFQYYRTEARVVFRDPETGELEEVTPQAFEVRVEELRTTIDPTSINELNPIGVPYLGPDDKLFHYEKPTKIYYRAFLAVDLASEDRMLLEHKKLDIGSFTLSACTAFKNLDFEANRMLCFGPLETIAEANLYINKSVNLILEIMARDSKGGGFIGRSALGERNEDAFMKDISRAGAWSVLEDDAFERNLVQFKPTSTFPAGLGQLIDKFITFLSDISGISPYFRGTATQERSNVLVSNLQMQTLVVLAPLLDNMASYRMRSGRIMAKMAIKELHPSDLAKIIGPSYRVEGVTHEKLDGEWVEIQGPKGPVTPVSLLLDVDPFEFDVDVDTTSASPTTKQALWQMWTNSNMSEQLREGGIPPPLFMPALLRNSPWPASFSEPLALDIERLWDQQNGDPGQRVLAALGEGLPPDQALGILQQVAQQITGVQPQEASPGQLP